MAHSIYFIPFLLLIALIVITEILDVAILVVVAAAVGVREQCSRGGCNDRNNIILWGVVAVVVVVIGVIFTPNII